MAILVT